VPIIGSVDVRHLRDPPRVFRVVDAIAGHHVSGLNAP